MAFDGIITYAIAKQLSSEILLGKIEKIYQPEKFQLVFHIHTRSGHKRLFASADSSAPRINLTGQSFDNPPSPSAFCMLLRKHLQGARIEDIKQVDSERIIEIYFKVLDELGFTVSKKLVFEIMGKHSNIVLVDVNSNRILDSIKRISIDVNRARQILPGMQYALPPSQDKVSFKSAEASTFLEAKHMSKDILAKISGISPSVAGQLAIEENPKLALMNIISDIESLSYKLKVYIADKEPREFHILQLDEFKNCCRTEIFDDISSGIEFYFSSKHQGTQLKQRKLNLEKNLKAAMDKLLLKKKRVQEDILKAENSENLRLYGELLTANLHSIKPGSKSVTLTNYYDNTQIEIPLDERFSPAKNAQLYYKKYGKAMTAIKEKTLLLGDIEKEVIYLDSVINHCQDSMDMEALEEIQHELAETGYMRRSKVKGKEKKSGIKPYKFTSPSGFTILVGRNNKENDTLTLKTASKNDLWFHTKDIPGSHVIMATDGKEADESDIKYAAAIAAGFSKAKQSSNVPVDYVSVKHIKKPAGAKPGMVIFKNNHTVYVNPILPI